MDLMGDDPARRANAHATKVVLLPYAVIGLLVAALPAAIADPLCHAISFCGPSAEDRLYAALMSSSVRLQIIAMGLSLPYVVWKLGRRWQLPPHVMQVSSFVRSTFLVGAIVMALIPAWVFVLMWTMKDGSSTGTGTSRAALFRLMLQSEIAFSVVGALLFCAMAMFYAMSFRLITTIHQSRENSHGR